MPQIQETFKLIIPHVGLSYQDDTKIIISSYIQTWKEAEKILSDITFNDGDVKVRIIFDSWSSILKIYQTEQEIENLSSEEEILAQYKKLPKSWNKAIIKCKVIVNADEKSNDNDRNKRICSHYLEIIFIIYFL